MKKIITLLAAIAITIACNRNDDNRDTTIEGNWKLVEILADPGDGSGTFQAVESAKVITFSGNGTVASNGNICDMTTDAASPSNGIYSAAENVIIPDCDTIESLVYTIQGNHLIINYPCFEPCRAKYVRVD
jgi:hypothetical protein